jgi:2,4-dienoyl-CoA reductase-like NADH-dependent reductase (Old Yellow Enzyme family)
MSKLFSPLKMRELTLENRIAVSPMCQYSSHDGMPVPWHLVHLGSRAQGGAALVAMEATAVSPEGRITPDDMGLWSSRHAEAMRPITDFIVAMGAVPAIQLAHAGRKASTMAPWRGGGPLAEGDGGWRPVAPSAIAFQPGGSLPRAMTGEDIDGCVGDFVASAGHALHAGFQIVELHMAHGYLLHEFLSPLSNWRDDEYGGSFDNRVRLPIRVAQAVRSVWPAKWPVFVRISATDWVDGGWSLDDSIRFARALRDVQVDLVDCSSGGNVPSAPIPVGPGYQVPFAEAIRRQAQIATGAVGLITEPLQAEAIVAEGKADLVLLARAMLRDPYWALHAARVLGAPGRWPVQYARASA